jgi:tetratricopeptide (TPR) repeat protein
MSGSRTFIKAGLLAQADYAATQAADLCRQLVAHDPVNADYRNQCGAALFALGKTKQRLEDWREANTVYLEAQQMLKQALIDTPDSLQDREFLIAAYIAEAQIILQNTGDLKAAIEQDEAAEKVGDGIGDVYVQLGVLSAHIQAWETGQFLELKHALSEHEAAKQLIASLSTPDNLASEYISSRLKAARMQLAYSDGDTAAGDELYADLRDRHYHDMDAVTRIRKRLCKSNSVLHHRHCAAIEEWKLPVQPAWVTPSG